MPILYELVKDVRRRFPLEYGRIEDYDAAENKFLVFIPMRKKTVKLSPPPWMEEKITIPAGSLTITIPSQTVTDSAGDTVSIPQQIVTVPDADTEIERFTDFSKFIGWWVIVTFPKSAPAIAGFLGR